MNDAQFDGAVPRFYEQFMVPMLFAPYAADLVARVLAVPHARVLELAAGTGVVTREMAARLPPTSSITATDLNQPMLDCAAALGTTRPVTWRCADAMQLPFDDGSFDVVVCQFGVMFFSPKSQAFAQVLRVLAPRGHFLFNTWGSLETNPLTAEVNRAVGALYPNDPPRFMERTPHGYHDVAQVEADLRAGGFEERATIETVTLEAAAPSPQVVARALCEGTPLRNEIEKRGTPLEQVTERAADALTARYGEGRIKSTMQAHVVLVGRD